MDMSARAVHSPLFAADRDLGAPLVSFVGGRTHSVGDVRSRTRAIAFGLLARGCAPGRRVAVMAGNRIEFIEVAFACSLIGAVLVPINPALRGAPLTRLLELTEPECAVLEGECVEGLRDAGWDRSRPLFVLPGSEAVAVANGVLPYDDLSGSGAEASLPAVRVSDPFCVYLSSGTTGPSKGVVLPHGAVFSMARTGQTVLGMTPDDVIYSPMPLYHANAFAVMFFAALLSGARTVLSRRFSVSRFWDEVVQLGATKTSLLGSAGALLLNAPAPPPGAHRLEAMVLIPRPPEAPLLEERVGVVVGELYGSTEAGLPLGVPAGEQRPASCGRPLDGWQCELVDHNDVAVPPGAVGELVVRPQVPWSTALGYLGQPERTVELWRNLWIHTGDLMRRDGDGWYFYVDRLKDAIRVSGENVASGDIEGVIASMVGVEEVAAFGVRSDLGEQDVMVAIVPSVGHVLTAGQVRDRCVAMLPYYAVPRYVEFVSSLPKTSTEKVRKAALRERGVGQATVDLGRQRRPVPAALRAQETTEGR
jgi:crotonobetaine/carnitine-CoA ligase